MESINDMREEEKRKGEKCGKKGKGGELQMVWDSCNEERAHNRLDSL